jgi:hypothetical protein
MSRRTLLLLCPLLFIATLSAHAQIGGRSEFAWQDQNAPDYLDPRPWVSAMQPNPRFPITVQLSQESRRYTGISWIGYGEGHIFNPRGENIEFHYRCGVTIPSGVPIEFYGRWVQPYRKLDILLRNPVSGRTRTCRISMSVVLPPSSTPDQAP